MFALSEFTDPALVDRGLQLALSPTMRSQDTALYLSRFLANPAVHARAWAFVKAHWTALEPKVTIFGGDANLTSALGSFCDAGTRDDVKAFFAAHPLPAAARTLKQTIERIDNCIALREKQTPVLTGWLSHPQQRSDRGLRDRPRLFVTLRPSVAAPFRGTRAPDTAGCPATYARHGDRRRRGCRCAVPTRSRPADPPRLRRTADRPADRADSPPA